MQKHARNSYTAEYITFSSYKIIFLSCTKVLLIACRAGQLGGRGWSTGTASPSLATFMLSQPRIACYMMQNR